MPDWAKVRDELMFLVVVVIANLMGTDRVKRCWPRSEEVLQEYLSSLGAALEIRGANADRVVDELETRESITGC